MLDMCYMGHVGYVGHVGSVEHVRHVGHVGYVGHVDMWDLWDIAVRSTYEFMCVDVRLLYIIIYKREQKQKAYSFYISISRKI